MTATAASFELSDLGLIPSHGNVKHNEQARLAACNEGWEPHGDAR